MHYLDNDVSGDCSLINWDNVLLVKFLILLTCNQLKGKKALFQHALVKYKSCSHLTVLLV